MRWKKPSWRLEEIVFNTELSSVNTEDSFTAKFSDGQVIDDGMLFLCLDNSPALTFLGDNWGPDADKKVRESTYGAIMFFSTTKILSK